MLQITARMCPLPPPSMLHSLYLRDPLRYSSAANGMQAIITMVAGLAERDIFALSSALAVHRT